MKAHSTIRRSKLTPQDKFNAKRAASQFRKYKAKGYSARDAFILYGINDRKLGWTLTADLWNTHVIDPKEHLTDNGVRFIYNLLKGARS